MRKIVYVVPVDWFFYSHFLERAVAAQHAGYDVCVVTKVTSFRSRIEGFGFRLYDVGFSRSSVNPIVFFFEIVRICKFLRNERPHMVHQVALRPIIVGSIAAIFSYRPRIVNAIVGGGFVFSSPSIGATLLRPILRFFLSAFLNPSGSIVVFENRDDLDTFVKDGFVRASDAVLISGAGVDPGKFSNCAEKLEEPLIILPARLIWDKGIGEFVEAAQILRTQNVSARFVVVGGADIENRASIAAPILEKWRREGIVEFWGFQTNMSEVFRKATIVCLPSYREGLPKALLEAMAAGLPCVTTDVIGCRDAVRHEDNGLLVPARDAKALAGALRRLIEDRKLCKRLGARGRERLIQEFSSDLIIKQTLGVYERIGNESH